MKTLIRQMLSFTLPILSMTLIPVAESAVIGADGGITLYVSYDNTDIAGGVSWNDNITQSNGSGGITCTPTNNARSAQGAPASPGSCPGGDTCLGREKLAGDIELLAQYIYQSTHGEHYLRRVYLSDNGRAWNAADIRWSVGTGGSSAPSNGWVTPGVSLNMRSAFRRCIHDVAHHELGHYFYNLPDRYARSGGYYRGRIGGGSIFDVDVDVGDPNTVMSGNFPHRFVDTTNASITISYDPPGSSAVNNEVLTPSLLTDADPGNDGPDRAHHGHTHPFAQDEWSLLPSRHADLSGVHTEGDFTDPDFSLMPAVDIRFLGEDEPHPGTILLLDRSGSMGVTTHGITAAQYVQEAGMYLYHSSLPGDFVGTHLYNASIEELFPYAAYDATNNLPFASFRVASGLTNIAAALESAIDAFIAEHGEMGSNGGQIVLMSDGKQTTGPSLWDQVTRAVDRGIQIHTLSFGNADTATMEAISTATDGDVIEMSEVSDGSELKLGMARELSELRGLTPIHFEKKIIDPNTSLDRVPAYQGTFDIPRNNRALQFYVFLTQSNAANLQLELEDPAGNLYKANPQNVANLGRLNGITVQKPEKGTWTYRILGRKGYFPYNEPMEIIGYVENRDLDTSLSVVPAQAPYTGQYRILAQVQHRYPLTNLTVTAYLYRGHTLIGTVPLRDDGKAGIDDAALDGLYAGVFYPEQYGISGKRPKVRIDVNFTTNAKTRPAPNAHYETGADLRGLTRDYLKRAHHVFTAFATDTVSFSNKDDYRPSIRIIDSTATKVFPGYAGKIVVGVANAYVSLKSLRASLGQGITVNVDRVQQNKRTLGATVYLSYRVNKDARNGTRELLLQNNQMRVEADNVLLVKGGLLEPPKTSVISPLKGNIQTFDISHPHTGGLRTHIH